MGALPEGRRDARDRGVGRARAHVLAARGRLGRALVGRRRAALCGRVGHAGARPRGARGRAPSGRGRGASGVAVEDGGPGGRDDRRIAARALRGAPARRRRGLARRGRPRGPDPAPRPRRGAHRQRRRPRRHAGAPAPRRRRAVRGAAAGPGARGPAPVPVGSGARDRNARPETVRRRDAPPLGSARALLERPVAARPRRRRRPSRGARSPLSRRQAAALGRPRKARGAGARHRRRRLARRGLRRRGRREPPHAPRRGGRARGKTPRPVLGPARRRDLDRTRRAPLVPRAAATRAAPPLLRDGEPRRRPRHCWEASRKDSSLRR